MTKKHLKTALGLMRDAKRRIQPDGAWVLRTRANLLKTMHHEVAAMRVPSSRERSKALILAFFPRNVVDVVRGPVMAAISVIGMMLGGSLASVSAAEQSVPGDFLFPVKLAGEQAQLLLQKESQGKLKLKNEFVGKRTEELKKINASNVPSRTERVKEATGIMKKDLDAVKVHLNTVLTESTSVEAATLAKAIEKTSTEAAEVAKVAKELVPEETKLEVTEMQVAAVSTGIKAVQVMIDRQTDPGVNAVVSKEDLKRTVTEQVKGMEQGLLDAEKKTPMGNASSSEMTLPRTTSTQLSLDQFKTARTSLQEMRQLLEEEKLSEAGTKLEEAGKAVGTVEKTAAATPPPTPPKLAETPPLLITSSTLPVTGTTSSTSLSTSTSTATSTLPSSSGSNASSTLVKPPQ